MRIDSEYFGVCCVSSRASMAGFEAHKVITQAMHSRSSSRSGARELSF